VGKEQVSAATLGSYIWGVVIPLVELPRGRSSTREMRPKCQQLHLGHWGGGSGFGVDVED